MPRPVPPPPALLERPRALLVAAVLLLVPFLVPIPGVLERSVVIATLGDRAHVVLFVVITLVLYWRGPTTGRLAAAALVAAGVGAAIEVVQGFVGRAPLLHDFLLDLVGIAAAAGWVAWRGRRRRTGLVVIVAALLLVAWELRTLPARHAAAAAMKEQLPLLTDFDGPHALALWRTKDCTEIATVDAGGGRGAVLRVTGAPPEPWPGASLVYAPHDWTAWDTLKLDLRLVAADTDTVRIGVRLDDQTSRKDSDWLAHSFPVTRTWRTVALPYGGQSMEWSGRPFDAHDVFAVALYLVKPDSTVVFDVDAIRLE